MAAGLRIATFNLESLDDQRDAEPPLEARIAVLRPQLERLAADVLCVQEVNGQRPRGGGPRQLRALDRLLARTRYEGYHRVASTSPSGPHRGVADRHNLVTLSRFPIVESREIRHDLVPAPRYRPVTAHPSAASDEPVAWERPVIHAVIQLPERRRLHVFNLHLRAPLASRVEGQKEDAWTWKSVSGWAEGFFLAAVKRIGEAFETRLAVEAVFDAEPDPLICVCGDCNAEEREMPLRVLRAEVEDTGNAALAPRVLVSLEGDLPAERRFTVLHGGHRAMLDHILVSRALATRFEGIEAHNIGLGDELVAHASAHRSPESYHAPLVAAFRLNGLASSEGAARGPGGE